MSIYFRKPHLRAYILMLLVSLLLLGGCAGSKKEYGLNIRNTVPADQNIGEVQIREFLLSPGDEIKISVYQHEELNRSVRIPPDGKIFYPVVGEIKLTGTSLGRLRDIITEGLSRYKKQTLLPGDEISIIVFRNDEYNRKFVIPSDGFIFFPHVGDINIEGKTLREIRAIITKGLSKYVVDPQVIIDITELNNPSRIANPQVSIEITGMGGQKIFILGEVNKPGVFFANGFLDIVEAVSMAGGPTLDANQKSVLIIRRRANEARPELITSNLEQILRSGDVSQNIILQKGDIIFMPRTYIADVDRFFEHLQKIVSPLLDLEKGYWIGQNIEAGPRGTILTSP